MREERSRPPRLFRMTCPPCCVYATALLPQPCWLPSFAACSINCSTNARPFAMHCCAAGIYNLLSHGSEWGLPSDVASTLEECRADLTSLQLLLLLLEQGRISEASGGRGGCWGRRRCCWAGRARARPPARLPVHPCRLIENMARFLPHPPHVGQPRSGAPHACIPASPAPAALQEQAGRYACGWLLQGLRRLATWNSTSLLGYSRSVA